MGVEVGVMEMKLGSGKKGDCKKGDYKKSDCNKENRIATLCVCFQKLHAFRATTGEHLYEYKTMGRTMSSPAVHGDRVVFGSHDRSVYCINQTTGVRLWYFRPRGASSPPQ